MLCSAVLTVESRFFIPHAPSATVQQHAPSFLTTLKAGDVIMQLVIMAKKSRASHPCRRYQLNIAGRRQNSYSQRLRHPVCIVNALERYLLYMYDVTL